MAEYRYYLIPDAMTRAFPEQFGKQTPTEFFDNIADLEKRYHQLREMPYNNERTWNERTRFPYARLVVGVDRQNPDGAVAIIQVRNGINYLCDDYRGPYADGSDAQIPQMAKKLVEVIGVDRVRPHTYTQRDGYTWVQVEKDEIWEKTKEQRSTQMIFCDLSTPKEDGFDVYNDVRDKLVAKGIPKEEVQFIHDADTETKKAELFGKVRNGTVRVLMGSTQKMGAGTNVQTRLIALHHLDCPWRPADIAQRNGRMVRQGNLNKEVSIFIYVTESTFDSYSWQLVENKQKFISQIMTSKSPARSCEDLDEAALTYAEIKALAAGNPMIKEKMDLDIQVARLRTLKAAYTSQHYRLEDAIAVAFPRQIKGTEHRIRAFEQDIQTVKEHQSYDADKKLIFSIELDGKTYDKREDAGKALLGLVGAAVRATKPVPVGHYAGFEITVEYKPLEKVFHAHLVGEATHTTELGNDAAGNMIRFQNVVSALPQDLNRLHGSLEQLTKQLTNAEEELKQPFLQEQELSDKSARLAELDALLNVGNDAPIIEGEAEELEEEPEDALIQSDDELER